MTHPKTRAATRTLHQKLWANWAAFMVLGLSVIWATHVWADEGKITRSHGYSFYGDLTYPVDYPHFNYVNPDAPKGGRIVHPRDVVRHDDPVFEQARRAGLTTLLVAGRDGRSVSGRVAAIKTGAADDASAVVAPIAAIRIVHDVIGPDATKALEAQIKRGKAYIEKYASQPP